MFFKKNLELTLSLSFFFSLFLVVFSVGLDRVIKKANAKDGIVKIKNDDAIQSDPACICVNDSFVAVGTDEGDLYVFDQTDLSLIKHWPHAHEDNMTAVFPLPEKNKYHFVTCGSSTVTHLDIRKEKPVSESEDQEDEILCGCMANEKTPVFGMSTGVLTKWNPDLEDQQHRVRLSQDSVDSVLPGEVENVVYAGCGDGVLYKVNARSSVILKKYNHGSDGIAVVEMDYQYHPVTADMDSIKIWRTDEEEEEYAEELAKAKAEEKEESKKRKGTGSDSDNSDWEDVESAQEDDKQKKKKRKRGKNSAKNKVYGSKPAITAFDDL